MKALPINSLAVFLRSLLARALGLEAACIELFEHARKLDDEDAVADFNAVVAHVGSYLSSVIKGLAERFTPSAEEHTQALVEAFHRRPPDIELPPEGVMLVEAYIEAFPSA